MLGLLFYVPRDPPPSFLCSPSRFHCIPSFCPPGKVPSPPLLALAHLIAADCHSPGESTRRCGSGGVWWRRVMVCGVASGLTPVARWAAGRLRHVPGEPGGDGADPTADGGRHRGPQAARRLQQPRPSDRPGPRGTIERSRTPPLPSFWSKSKGHRQPVQFVRLDCLHKLAARFPDQGPGGSDPPPTLRV